jgi:PAS domain S-box-containing protein
MQACTSIIASSPFFSRNVFNSVIEMIIKKTRPIKHNRTELSNSKKAMKLMESEAIQNALVQQRMHGVAILQDEIHKFVNKAMERITGYDTEELIGMSYLDVLTPGSRPYVRKKYKQVVGGSLSPFIAELKFLCKDGSVKDVEVYNNVIELQGKPAIISVVHDISTQKKAEEALRESELRFQAFMTNFPGIAFMRDIEGNYIFMNDKFASLIEGNNSKSSGVATERTRNSDRFTRPDDAVITKGKTLNTIGKLPQKDGMHFWLTYRFPIISNTGKTAAVGGIGVDITERTRMEIELEKSRKRLSNLVANLHKVREDLSAQVAEEIHDELGQMLTAIKFDLTWLEKKMPKDSAHLRGKIATMSQELDQAIQSVGRIASQLRPRLLDELGLTSAMKWYTEEFQKRTEIMCRMKFEPEEISLDKTTSTAIFRILQETLTNVARHSKARNVKLNLKVLENKVIMHVIDDGIGITNEEMNRPDAFGLLSVKERANFVGGTVRISGTANKGTRIVVTIPMGLHA